MASISVEKSNRLATCRAPIGPHQNFRQRIIDDGNIAKIRTVSFSPESLENYGSAAKCQRTVKSSIFSNEQPMKSKKEEKLVGLQNRFDVLSTISDEV